MPRPACNHKARTHCILPGSRCCSCNDERPRFLATHRSVPRWQYVGLPVTPHPPPPHIIYSRTNYDRTSKYCRNCCRMYPLSSACDSTNVDVEYWEEELMTPERGEGRQRRTGTRQLQIVSSSVQPHPPTRGTPAQLMTSNTNMLAPQLAASLRHFDQLPAAAPRRANQTRTARWTAGRAAPTRAMILAPEPKNKKEQEEEQKCIICDSEADTTLKPCGHRVLCLVTGSVLPSLA